MDLKQYYVNQAGSGFSEFYSGQPFQKGYGLGSFLGGLFRSVLPFVRKGATVVGRETARAGSHILSDLAAGDNARASLKRHLNEVGTNLTTRLQHHMNGNGITIKKRKILPKRYSRRKRRAEDLFDL